MTGLRRRLWTALAAAGVVVALASCSTNRTSSAANHASSRLRSDVAAASAPAGRNSRTPPAANKASAQGGVGLQGTDAAPNRAVTAGQQQSAANQGASQGLNGSQLPSPPTPPTDHPQPPPGQKAPTALLHTGPGLPANNSSRDQEEGSSK
jgi:hypothetical protein